MGYGSIPQQIFEGNSSYHSLQVTANRRFSNHVQFGVSFTHSKAMDYAEGDSTSTSGVSGGGSNTVARYLNRKIWNYGLASYDRPNVLTMNFLVDVPGLPKSVSNGVLKNIFNGWQLSNIVSFIPGSPQQVSMTTNPTVPFFAEGDGASPLLVGDPTLPKDQRTVSRFFNTSAYAEPIPITAAQCASGTCPAATWVNYGNASTASFRGPGRNNWNTAVYKTFVVHEKFRIQFRAEAYNTFNHTQFNAIDTTIQFNAAGVNTRTSSGNITSARDPRIMQFALRLNF
jgi:hypothetical protein